MHLLYQVYLLALQGFFFFWGELGLNNFNPSIAVL